jgi:predicted enzyme related to lactoylglutathione lyase
MFSTQRIATLAAISILTLWTLTPTQAQAPAPAGAVIGVGNFSHIVTSLEKSVEFYRDVIGLEVTTAPQQFASNAAIMKMGNTPGAQSRIAVLKAPGAALGVELIEYKDIERKPSNPRFQDPGAANLQVRVRDVDAVVARVKKSSGRILTVGGNPASIGGGSKIIFIQDPDGFVLELIQGAAGRGAAPAQGESPAVLGLNFEATVEDAVKSAAFYKDLLGFQMSAVAAYNGDKTMTDTAGVPGSQFRQTRATIPGTSVTMTLIEFKDTERKTNPGRVQDPGTAILQLMVRDIDAVLATLKAGGAKVVATDGQVVSVGTSKIVLVRDPNNLILELIQR